MFQFRGLASFRIVSLQDTGLSHSEISGLSDCMHLTGAYRSLPRPSSPLSAKASTMRPCFALNFFKSGYNTHHCVNSTSKNPSLKVQNLSVLFSFFCFSLFFKKLSLLEKTFFTTFLIPKKWFYNLPF